jgi:hypothetical protein
VLLYRMQQRAEREREKKRGRTHELPPRLLILLLRMARLLEFPCSNTSNRVSQHVYRTVIEPLDDPNTFYVLLYGAAHVRCRRRVIVGVEVTVGSGAARCALRGEIGTPGWGRSRDLKSRGVARGGGAERGRAHAHQWE